MANNEFQTSVSKTFGSLPSSDAGLASYLQKRKNQGKHLSPTDGKYLQACHQQWKPVTGFWPQNEKKVTCQKKCAVWRRIAVNENNKGYR